MTKLILPGIDPPTPDEYAAFNAVTDSCDKLASDLRRLGRVRNDFRYTKLAELIEATKGEVFNIVSETGGGHRGR